MIEDMYRKLYGSNSDPPKGDTTYGKIEWYLAHWRQETSGGKGSKSTQKWKEKHTISKWSS